MSFFFFFLYSNELKVFRLPMREKNASINGLNKLKNDIASIKFQRILSLMQLAVRQSQIFPDGRAFV